MRVLFVSPFYPPYEIGGAEQSVFLLASALRKRGHDVRVVSLRLGDEETPSDVPLDLVDAGIRLERPGVPLRPRTFDRPRLQVGIARAVAGNRGRTDLVHCQTLHLLPGAYLGARRIRLPIVATARDVAAVCPLGACLVDGTHQPADCNFWKLGRDCLPRYYELYGAHSKARLCAAAAVGFASVRIRGRLLGRCDAVVSVSAALKAAYVEAGIVRKDAVHVIPTPAGSADAAPAGARRDFALYAGKFSPGKGGEYVLAAVRIARSAEPEFRLVVAGFADARWQRLLEATPGVEYRRWLPRHELHALYESARFAVVASVSPDALPRAALEASAHGVPVVGTTVGGIPEVVVHRETGLLVEPRDAGALAESMLGLWRDEALAAKLGAAGRARAATVFSPESVVDKTERLYSHVLAGHRGPS
jgi:glycosyltransferase involved in cell wall biosynthesis